MTSSPEKDRLYRLDPAYRSGRRSLQEALGDPSVLYHRALVILRPDAFYFRKAHHIVDFLRANGFAPTAWQPFRLSWHQVLDLWRYQLTKATDDRLGLGCELLSSDTSVLLLLAETEPGEIPASVRLWSLKGAFDARARSRGNLRDRLAVPHRMFGFLHTADEPIDLVRELGVLLPHQRRLEIMRRAERGKNRSEALRRFIDRRYESLPALEWMSANESVSRLRSRCVKRENDIWDLLNRIEQQICGSSAPGSLTFGSFYPALRRLHGNEAKLERWLLYMAAAQILELDLAGVAPILSSGRADLAVREWADRGRKEKVERSEGEGQDFARRAPSGAPRAW